MISKVMKGINIIVYLPGYAGRFCQFLMSLHETTHPYIPLSMTPLSTDSRSRAEMYSYKNIYKKHGSWKNHHDQFHNELLDENYYKFLLSAYDTLTFSIHPYEFYPVKLYKNHIITRIMHIKDYHRGNFKGIKYAQIFTSNMEEEIKAFRLKNLNFPVLRDNEVELNSKFTSEFYPYIINLDNFFKGEEFFLNEYKSLASYFEIPEQTELVLEFYHDWIEARNSIP